MNKQILNTIPSTVLNYQIPGLWNFVFLVSNLFSNYLLQFTARNDALMKMFTYKQTIKNSPCFTRTALVFLLKTFCFVEVTKRPTLGKH